MVYWNGTFFVVDMAMEPMCLHAGNTVTPDDNNGFLGEHAQLTQVNQAALANYQYGKPPIIRLIYRHLQPTGVRGRSQPDAL